MVIHFFFIFIICERASITLMDKNVPDWIYSETEISFLSQERPTQFQFFFNRFVPFDDMINSVYRSSRYGMPDVWRERGSQMRRSKITFQKTLVKYDELFSEDNNPLYILMRKLKRLKNEFIHNNTGTQKGLWLNGWFRSPAFEHQFRKNEAKDYDFLFLFFFGILRTARDIVVGGKRLDLGISSLDHLTIIFILNACEKLPNNKELQREICPNVCLSLPCSSINNVASPRCFGIKKSLYLSDYKCRCVSHHKWSKLARICERHNPCHLRETCHKEGTKKCVYHTERNLAICVCKETHMGSRCQTTRNPCLEQSDPINIVGQKACAVSRGNRCIPMMGTDFFKCECRDQWIHDFSFAYPNCLAFRDQCSSTLCIRGDCVSSMDGRMAKCICPLGFIGQFCERHQANWALWSPWTGCDPRCGIARRSIRMRNCDGESCQGASRQARLCEPDYCGEHPMFQLYSPLRWKLAKYVGFLARWLVTIAMLYGVCVSAIMILIVAFPSLAADLVILLEG